MLTTIEGSFVGGQFSRAGQLKRLHIKTSDRSAGGQVDRIQQIKVPKTLRPILERLLKSSTYLKLQVKTGHHHLKAVSVLTVLDDYRPNETKSYIPSIRVQVCSKGSCHKHGSGKICEALQVMIQERNLQDVVFIEKVGCLKECKHAPNVRLKPSGIICHKASSPKVAQLLEPMLAS
jgi:NADH:ubiquinone oxidoreductase subunit E